MKNFYITLIALAGAMPLAAQTIVETEAYRWHGDTITQGEFYATAPSPYEIVSTYSARPGYYMGIDKQWKLKNDISSYPKLTTGNTLHEAIYNMGLDEMVNAVEPDTTLRTGKEWSGVWTRDVSYSILLSMAYMQPEASKISLMKKVDRLGRIIQDTGSGGAWPVSTDREIWAVAAYEVYKVTGDRQWLEYIYPIIKRSLETDAKTVYDSPDGLVKGETSFIDWREQSYPKWMQTADIYNSEALSTSIIHAQAWHVLAEIATALGHKDVAAEAQARADKIAEAVNSHLWMGDKGYYAMYDYGRQNLILNPRAETLGESLAIMWDIAPADRQAAITENNPTTPFGTAIFYPQIADMPSYHNNALWPWVGAWWGLANAKVGNEDGVMQAIGSVFRPAALFCTNKENFNLDNGDIYTELNSSNMLWCLSGNIALTHRVLFGIEFMDDGLAFHPFVPKALGGGTMQLDNFDYRGAKLDITVKGYGNKIKSFKVNGKSQKPFIAASKAKGNMKVEIVMADNDIPAMRVNNVANAKAPLTPLTRFEGKELAWNPIEYIDHYVVIKDGKRIATVNTTTFDASEPGEYQVIGVDSAGNESFASEPLYNGEVIKLNFHFHNPGDLLNSPETAYQPKHRVQGYRNGYLEVDKSSEPIVLHRVVFPEDGEYFMTLRYANGNGPVNTENRCAIRAVTVDGVNVGTLVMPQRGVANWDDWGWSNRLPLTLTAGPHDITIEFMPEDENMNIDTNHFLLDGVYFEKKY